MFHSTGSVRGTIMFGIFAFAACCSAVALLRHYLLHRAESHETISDGLTGPWYVIEDAGFVALVAVLALLAYWSPSLWVKAFASLVALGAFLAMITDSLRPQLERLTGVASPYFETAHLTGAGFAYGGALFLECALTAVAPRHRIALAIGVAALPGLTGITRLVWPTYTAWQEKVATFAICIYFCLWASLF